MLIRETYCVPSYQGKHWNYNTRIRTTTSAIKVIRSSFWPCHRGKWPHIVLLCHDGISTNFQLLCAVTFRSTTLLNVMIKKSSGGGIRSLNKRFMYRNGVDMQGSGGGLTFYKGYCVKRIMRQLRFHPNLYLIMRNYNSTPYIYWSARCNFP